MLGRLGSALARLHHDAVHVPRVQRLHRALSRLLASSAIDELLDVGCGDGSVAAGVARELRAKAVGVEILVRPGAVIDVLSYDGVTLPFEDASFDAVMICDVLHHAEDPERLLRECLRVTRGPVVVKDHFAFGVLSDKLLWLMDVVGNAAPGVEVRGTYFTPESWRTMVTAVGAQVAALHWPLRIHDLPWRIVTRSELQFAARLELS